MLDVVKDKLSSVEEKLSKNPPSASTQQQPISPVTEQADVKPMQPPLIITTTASNVNHMTTSIAPGKEDDKLPSTGDGQNTNVPTGEPTTPLTESTEAHPTGATGDMPQTEGPALLNVSSDATDGGVSNSSTEGEVATMEGVTSATEGPPSTDSKEEEEKKTNEQAMAALKSECPLILWEDSEDRDICSQRLLCHQEM